MDTDRGLMATISSSLEMHSGPNLKKQWIITFFLKLLDLAWLFRIGCNWWRWDVHKTSLHTEQIEDAAIVPRTPDKENKPLSTLCLEKVPSNTTDSYIQISAYKTFTQYDSINRYSTILQCFSFTPLPREHKQLLGVIHQTHVRVLRIWHAVAKGNLFPKSKCHKPSVRIDLCCEYDAHNTT